ncbi:hypothetical protein BIZ37_07975 [Photobacterium sp. BZF1]|uniref:hypothetical protein n=1 Tax=Photobacterium sp. BZF1 TaxID=1904457 RepID=UPI0016534FA3|nr:hypothetical protein [Photobacterium sp. BZF1]MBC7002494.1 hypothetical protein [Photobacterium sp. BZF1]
MQKQSKRQMLVNTLFGLTLLWVGTVVNSAFAEQAHLWDQHLTKPTHAKLDKIISYENDFMKGLLYAAVQECPQGDYKCVCPTVFKLTNHATKQGGYTIHQLYRSYLQFANLLGVLEGKEAGEVTLAGEDYDDYQLLSKHDKILAMYNLTCIVDQDTQQWAVDNGYLDKGTYNVLRHYAELRGES